MFHVFSRRVIITLHLHIKLLVLVLLCIFHCIAIAFNSFGIGCFIEEIECLFLTPYSFDSRGGDGEDLAVMSPSPELQEPANRPNQMPKPPSDRHKHSRC